MNKNTVIFVATSVDPIADFVALRAELDGAGDVSAIYAVGPNGTEKSVFPAAAPTFAFPFSPLSNQDATWALDAFKDYTAFIQGIITNWVGGAAPGTKSGLVNVQVQLDVDIFNSGLVPTLGTVGVLNVKLGAQQPSFLLQVPPVQPSCQVRLSTGGCIAAFTDDLSRLGQIGEAVCTFASGGLPALGVPVAVTLSVSIYQASSY